MAKKTKELSQVKARQTKLGKKSNEELIQIILKKDKIERNLNNQIKSLKGEVNELSTRVNNFDKDIEGTNKTLSNYKNKIEDLLNETDQLRTSSAHNYELFTKESIKTLELKDKINLLKNGLIVMTIISIISIAVIIASL